jgi:8-oxo-dGTP pyrophosphatase MutT (NUDIX family)
MNDARMNDARMNDPAKPDPKALRNAATVMLLRDHGGALEVFMMKRTSRASFASGMYVFPGGAVDAEDSGTDLARHCDGLTDAEASERLGIASGGLAYWIAAVRECFEEAGVLLARDVRLDDPVVAERFRVHQHAVHGRERRFAEICKDEDLTLSLADIKYVAHWITPRAESRRFDTRFFVTRSPAGQKALHDDNELVDSEWITPPAALARVESNEFMMLPPTIAMLEFIAPHATVDSAMGAAQAVGTPPTIQPVAIMDGTRFVDLILPDDPRYPAARAAEDARAAGPEFSGAPS